jgi:glycosyltransferase involved in cell wall biosynthesis
LTKEKAYSKIIILFAGSAEGENKAKESVNKKYKVLHFITKLELGGAQKNTLYTVENLDRQSFKPILVSGANGFLVKEARLLPEVKCYLLPCLKREPSPVNDFRTCLTLLKIFWQERPTILHTHSTKAGVIGRLLGKLVGIPIIIHTIHGFGFHPYQAYLKRIGYIFLEKIAGLVSDKLIAVSHENVKTGLKVGIGSMNKYEVIRSGIEIRPMKFLSPQEVKQKKAQMGVKEDEKVVGMIACFKPQKAPGDFVEVAQRVLREVKNVKFLLVGDGILRKNIEKKISRLGLSSDIFLLGWREDVREIIQCLDVMVLTSLWEGLPRVILEAFSCGKPVVATAVDGSREIIKPGVNGFLSAPRDVKKMAEKVIFLLRNPQEAKRLGKAGQKSLYPEYEIKVMVKKLEELYQKLINEYEAKKSSLRSS